jgi:hypothetical protein
MVEEAAYGSQVQVDFGEYNMRDNQGKRVKVFFFTMVLSRSRYKYIWFTNQYFTSELAVQAHEQGFFFFGGIPDEIVYDQDKVFIVSENKGDIILTEGFRVYTRERSFKLHFCKKSDPESKGKIENVVKYVKQNFLYNRSFSDIETLNQEALGWLGRTANQMVHGSTKKEPFKEWEIERTFLKPYTAYTQKPKQLIYTIRKDNTISWKSNLYSLPLGTYKGRGSTVAVKIENDQLIVCHCDDTEICRHRIAMGKGQKVKNTNHSRDKHTAIDEMIEQFCQSANNPEQTRQFLNTIRQAKPRYIRDQLLLFRQTIENTETTLVVRALDYCCQYHITSASDFKAIVEQYKQSEQSQQLQGKVLQMNPLSGSLPAGALIQPATSDIADYETILQTK